MSEDRMPDVIYVAEFTGNVGWHYNAKTEQAYVATRRTPLEEPHRNHEDYRRYYSESHVQQLQAEIERLKAEQAQAISEACEKQRKACAQAYVDKYIEIFDMARRDAVEDNYITKAILSARYDDKSTVESGDGKS